MNLLVALAPYGVFALTQGAFGLFAGFVGGALAAAWLLVQEDCSSWTLAALVKVCTLILFTGLGALTLADKGPL
jgi:hypothetical protein